MSGWRIVSRTEPREWGSVVIFAAAFALSLLICGLLLQVQGKDGALGVGLLLSGGFGHLYSYGETLLKAIPIFLCSLGVALCFRLQIWNIGAEGQYVIGTLGGTWFVLTFASLPGWLLLPGMLISAMLAGGFWACVSAVLRQRFGMNEIISTLMLNYIGIEILKYLIYGPWRDPAAMNFPVSPYFSDSAVIAQIWNSSFWLDFGLSENIVDVMAQLCGRAHWGILSCLIAGCLCSFFLQKTRLGYEITAAGSNAKAARFAGIPYSRLVILVMFICGALAGLAGIQECSATLERLEPHIVVGYGYTAVVVAWLAKLRTVRIAFFAIILAGLRVGVENVQLELQVSNSFANTLEGIILITVLAGQFFNDYSLKRKFS
ncbi:MAG: ABC transporter permease [Deltaproteobacteria bacterium]|nr:ABC transporter permease [Deltaproteobacteria bacterium]